MVCCYSSPDFPRLVQVSQFDVQLRQTNRSLLAHGLEHDFLVGFFGLFGSPLDFVGLCDPDHHDLPPDCRNLVIKTFLVAEGGLEHATEGVDAVDGAPVVLTAEEHAGDLVG